MIEGTELVTSRIVNTITAAPLLSLMIALDGMDGPGDPQRTWSVFKRFAQVPSMSSRDVLAFQVGMIPIESGAPLLTCSWLRLLTDDAAGYGELTRAIQVEYNYDDRLILVPHAVEIWSDQFASLTDFFQAVESQPQFTFMMETLANLTGLYVREVVDSDDSAEES